MDAVFDMVRGTCAAFLCGAGALVLIVASVACVRARDVYLRIHAAKPAALYAAPLALAGLAVAAWDAAIVLRLGVLAILLVGQGLVALHIAAYAARHAGVAPLTAADLRAGERAL